MGTYKKLKHIIENKATRNATKTRIFNTYLNSVFLYNSELWTLTKERGDDIDVFQRRQIRRAFNIDYQDRISNDDLYKLSGLKPLSDIIRIRRARWYGHLQRLDENTPARQALQEAKRKVKKPKGGQKLTWIKLIEKDFSKTDVPLDQIPDLAQDRPRWRAFTNRLELAHANVRGD